MPPSKKNKNQLTCRHYYLEHQSRVNGAVMRRCRNVLTLRVTALYRRSCRCRFACFRFFFFCRDFFADPNFFYLLLKFRRVGYYLAIQIVEANNASQICVVSIYNSFLTQTKKKKKIPTYLP